MATVDAPRIKVAIIGSGPAGLSAAIELSKLPFIDWRLYEQKPTISELGTGITLQRNTWRLLERLGAAKHLRASDFFRPADGHDVQYRNGRSGVVVKQTYPPSSVAPHHAPCRVHRAKLQKALLKEVDQSRIRLKRKLVDVERMESAQLRVVFEDGSSDHVDLVIGADGIRSKVRSVIFPNQEAKYSGVTAYRTVVRLADAEQINGLPKAMTFWHGTEGKWVYTCPLGANDWEITCRIGESDDGDRSTWGREASVPGWISAHHEYCEPVQSLLSLATRVKRYDYFGGSRLQRAVDGSSVALIGDASHPLSGAFGAGAAFAIEDAWVLAGAIDWAYKTSRTLEHALALFDQVRSPHYRALYQTLDDIAAANRQSASQAASAEEDILTRVENVSQPKNNWMYYHEVDKVLADAIAGWGDASLNIRPSL
ncbi:hypothetical protein B0J13DRAFT_618816 [Dactylonectria estremocensis]|uniref:FAD-binding domain-containing protein n=1 Tax=Dactylonectria estremocensis TaxID=1079267 RepID=A0A9P9F824_9HYPO|nr:hypothetical protein B0J13DRAFT_618816 [Dactylonectria estremocensis]